MSEAKGSQISQISTCRSCGGSGLHPFLSLGPMPLTDAYVEPDRAGRPDPRFPLDVALCPRCRLVQILHTVPPSAIFQDYSYFSSYSRTLMDHSRAHAAELIQERALGPDSFVLEVASNDGYLLRSFAERGIPVLGVDPARGPAAAARSAGIPTLRAFFGPSLAAGLRSEGVRPDVILANNVLAHVPDLNGFVAGLAHLLPPDGVLEVEVPYVADLVGNLEFDTIYHEHLCYFSVAAIEALFHRHALSLNDVRRLPIHGGSLRLSIARGGRPTRRVGELLEREAETGLNELATYRRFAARVGRLRRDVRRMLEERRSRGRRIAAYGAAAKGTVLLNACGIGADVVDFVADRSPHKQGRFMPGVGIPILPPEVIEAEMPDDVLVLAWNLLDEVRQQLRGYLARGGRLIVPLPEPAVLGPEVDPPTRHEPRVGDPARPTA